MAVTTQPSAGATAIRPFTIEIPEAEVEDLRSRVVATRFPEKEPVEDPSQGVQLATMQALVRYWGTQYDLRRVERRLNALPLMVQASDQQIAALPGLSPADSTAVTRDQVRGVFNEVDRGGHFAAWEHPELFSADFARASARSGLE
jgi:hypothetical protein